MLKLSLRPAATIGASLLLIWCVGILGRGYWTPDEPRESDIAWRMTWQADKAVPLLAGEAFCEKPPLTYWLAAVPIELFGSKAAWTARLPNLFYAVITALCVGFLAHRAAGYFAGLAAAAAIGTFLLSYQVAIWLASDAPLLAAVSMALLGAYRGFYASDTGERVRGYTLMHAAMGLGFLSKSAVAWMVPALTVATLLVWERRWRELLRWELYPGLILQAAMIFAWIWFVYVGPDGGAHLKIFFWNNLVGRFTRIDAPDQFQYAAAHHNSPGKYLLEMPLYLAPWTLLVLAALRRAWLQRKDSLVRRRAVRFALAAFLPPLVVLSLAATARNIYFAPALPGAALLLGWWCKEASAVPDGWDVRALRATSALLLVLGAAFATALALIASDSWGSLNPRGFIVISAAGLLAAAGLALHAWAGARWHASRALFSLLLAYCALLAGPASQIYRQVDSWQDLASIARAMDRDAAGKPLLLFAPDETTRAMIDMYARTSVGLIPGPLDAAAIQNLKSALRVSPQSLIVAQVSAGGSRVAQRLAGYLHLRRPAAAAVAAEPAWAVPAGLRLFKSYSLPNGRRYVLLELNP